MKVEKIKGVMYAIDKKKSIKIPIGDLITRLKKGEGVESIKGALGIFEHQHEWESIANAIFDEWKNMQTLHPDEALIRDCNGKLSPFAFSLPSYATAFEAKALLGLFDQGKIDETNVSKYILPIVMGVRLRAQQQVGRYMKIPIFKEFAYFIDSAALAFYRGNMAAAFLTIVPVIEGVLLRWMGFPSTLTKKPEFKEIKEFIGRSIYRNPTPDLPKFFEMFYLTADYIFRNHFYLNTEEGDAHGFFNRHLALHMLDDKVFYSVDNVGRAFLLLDLMSEIYLREACIEDPRWELKNEEIEAHVIGYAMAAKKSTDVSPESILSLYPTHFTSTISTD